MDELVQSLSIKTLLYHDKSELQEVVIFDNPLCGRVLAIDGAIQTTERDEYIYHEMLVHVPLMAHGAAEDVLIIGGGDGGALEELLKHPVKRATLVEVDRRVIDLSREHLRSICGAAFEDVRSEVVITDGARFIAGTDQRFDIILVDAPDPVGPAKALFTEAFYQNCKRCLKPGGIVVTQNGVPWMQRDELFHSLRALNESFVDTTAYLAPVPTYNGGFLAFGWATDEESYRQHDVHELHQRLVSRPLGARYYNADIHLGSFALPNDVREIVQAAL
ncbi:MAG: polyamine aminopropyltransferase [Deltaproteobacteria bacterium]|nr:polyamine aminopropyltransferase [Deltaproteobacteria bacterium]